MTCITSPAYSLQSTVVVTSQPIAQQLYVTVEPRAADNLVLTVVMMIVCASLLNPIVFICLVPALFFSLKVCTPLSLFTSTHECNTYIRYTYAHMHTHTHTHTHQAGAANEAGDYGLARRRGQHSLWLNLTAMISFIALMILGILLGVVLVITNA